MKYYVIRPSLNNNIIGHFPQVERIIQNCHVWNEPRFVENLQFTKADFEPITASAVLNKKSIITDLIDVAGMGFTKKLLVSLKMKSILELYRNSGLEFFTCKIIYQGNKAKNYWLLNMFEINMKYIDYPQSKFVFRKRKKNGGTITENVNISSFEEFQNVLSRKNEYQYTQFYIDNIKLMSNINEDFFALIHVEGGVKYVVSEKLKNVLEQNSCTGIEYMPIGMKLSDWLHDGRIKIYGNT